MTNRPCFAIALSAVLCACEKEPAPPGGGPEPSAEPSVAAPAPSAAPEGLAGAGIWKGTATAGPAPIDLDPKKGGLPGWKSDEGKQATGAVTITVDVADDGSVKASASGALGQLAGTGSLEGDQLAVDLAPTEPDGFRGVLHAKKDGESFRGELRASSADSALVRTAPVTLTR